MDSQWTQNGLTTDSQRTHNGLTTDSQWTHNRTHNGLTMDSQRTHKGFTMDSVVHDKWCFYTGVDRLPAKSGVFYIGFYKGCPRTVVFYIGCTRVFRGKYYKPCVKSTFFVDNPPGMVSPPEQQQALCPHNSPSYRIESPLARPHSFASPRPLACTNETKRFPGLTQAPQPPI